MKPTFLTAFLIFFSVIFACPAIAYNKSCSAPIAELSFNEELPPINKKEKSRKKKKRAPKNEGTWAAFVLIFFPTAFVIGGILFAIGIAIGIFGLWLAGLITLGLFNFIILLYLLISKFGQGKDIGTVSFSIYAALFLFMGLLNFILGLCFLIWGLIIANPLFWIVGAALLLLMIIYVWAALFENSFS